MLVIGLGTFTPYIGFVFALNLAPKPAGAASVLLSGLFGFGLGVVLFLWLYNRYVPLVVKHA